MKRSPQLENGYIRYAHELDAALAYADFTKGARIVLREVFAQMFGPADRRTVKLSPTELGKLFEINKGYFGRAIRELTDSGVLEKLGECEYRFVKDYGAWTRNGQRRLSDAEMKLAARATDRALMHKYPWVANPVNTHKPEQQAMLFDSDEDSGVQSGQREGCNPVNDEGDRGAIQATGRCQSSKRDVVNPVNEPHYIERARLENGEAERSSAAAPADPPEKKPAPPAEPEPEYPHPDRSILVPHPGEFDIPEAEARRIWSAIWHQWKKPGLCNEWYVRQRWFPAAIWRQAIQEAVLRGTRFSRWGYVEKIAGDIQANGARPDRAPQRNGNRHPEPPPRLIRAGDPLS